jgi:hypothetical protein
MRMIPKSKKGGTINDLVQGTGGLIIAVVIVLLIVSTILGANIITRDRYEYGLTTTTAVNETGTTFGNSTFSGAICTIISVINASDGGTIGSGNYTQTNCNIASTINSDYNNSAWNITATTTWDGVEETVADDMNANFSAGINNVSEKIPTILLIAAVVLLFGVLVILVAKSKEIGIGTGGASL